jgi:hypothetical protein
VPWIHENGLCMDRIDIGPAADPEMGRGAFATVPIRQGELVAPHPLQVYPSRKAMRLSVKQGKGNTINKEPLIINYCFQANNSDILFFPYGAGANLVNHGSPPNKANVGLRWSASTFSNTPWLDLPWDEFWDVAYPGGLILEFYALRDIKADEEILFDYGVEWETAWNAHVRQWVSPLDAEEYVYPASMDETKPLRTVDEQKLHPYADNLATVCNTGNWDRKGGYHDYWIEPKSNGHARSWTGAESMVFCHVIERTKGTHGDDVYTVMLSFDGYEPYDPTVSLDDQYVDYKVPRRAIRFFDKPYQSDEHARSAFRHSIGLPPELFPAQWRL